VSAPQAGEVAATVSVSAALAFDHRRLDGLLRETKRTIAAADLRRAAALFAEFSAGLERHIAAEEDILFPAFESLAAIGGGGPTRVMRSEHAEIRRLLAELAVALDGRDATARTTGLAVLTARLFAHNGKEERIIYPATERAARDAGTLPDLVRRIQLP
jgi:iron-sulfur cluster repair protein YtfE (RIC family)